MTNQPRGREGRETATPPKGFVASLAPSRFARRAELGLRGCGGDAGEEFLQPQSQELGLLDGGDVRAARDGQHLRPRDAVVHLLAEPVGRERIGGAGDDQRRHLHVRQVIERAVLAGVLEHAEEQPRVHGRQVPEVRLEVLRVHQLAVHFQMRGDLVCELSARRELPDQVGRVRPAVGRGDHRRQDDLQRLRVVEGVERQPVRAANQHQPLHLLRVPPVVLERHLHAHRVPEEDRLPHAGGLQHRAQVAADVVEADVAAILRNAAAAVAAVVPANDAVAGAEVAHQVLPGEAVAADAVAADQRRAAAAGDRVVDSRAVVGGDEGRLPRVIHGRNGSACV